MSAKVCASLWQKIFIDLIFLNQLVKMKIFTNYGGQFKVLEVFHEEIIIFPDSIVYVYISLSSGMLVDALIKVDKELNWIMDIMEQAVLDGDYPTIIKFYTEDMIIMPNFREPVRGKKALKALYGMEKEQGIKYQSFSSQVEKRWEADGDIYEYGSFGMSFSFNSVEKPVAYYGSYFQIWELVDGSYKIKYSIWNLDHNPL